MPWYRSIVGASVAALVAAVLLLAIAYMGRGLFFGASRDEGALLDPLANQQFAQAEAARERRLIEMRYPVAELPWVRDPANAHHYPVDVPAAFVPRLMPRRMISNPEPANLAIARVPWVRRIPDRPLPVTLETAFLPTRLKSMKNKK